MVVLALDTTTRVSSGAVARDGVVLREVAGDPAKPQAARLPGDLMTLLERSGITLPQIDVFAVATGPGSFTGLRIGIATMQGLAFAQGKPLIGVSGFDALERFFRFFRLKPEATGASEATGAAEAAGAPAATGAPEATGDIATWVDAWRGEVYAALYTDGREVMAPVVEHPDSLLANLPAATRGSITFVGDGAGTYRDLLSRTLGDRARIPEPSAPLLAAVIAQLATEAASAGGHLPSPHAIRPLYVRRPDAELARAQKVR
jgi:tRNA threonylcarbamoyladenosine biosynthesis protein TsaB